MTSPDRFRAAVDALSRSDFSAAQGHADALLRQQPNHPSLLQLRGVIASQAGDAATGAEFFRRAIAHGGDTADNRLNLGKALLASGRATEALAICEDPANTAPEFARLRAEVMRAAGTSQDAVAAYRQLADAHPNDFEAWNNLGNAQHAAGDLEDALASIQRARVLNPDSALVLINMGRVLTSLDRLPDACLVYEQATLLDPKDPLPLIELGRGLTALDLPDRALPALGTAARLDPGNPEVFVAIGNAFGDLAERAKAEQAYRVALQVSAGFAPAYLNLGLLLEQDNRVTDLEALLAQANAAGVNGDGTAYLQALLFRRQGKLEEALALARSIGSNALDPTVLPHFIAQLEDRLGHVAAATQAFEDMNREAARSPLGLTTDAGAYQRSIQRTTSATTAEWFERWPPVEPITEPPAPAFLVGFPRSGTTLLDTLLLGHSRAHVLEEVPVLQKVADAAGDLTRIDALDPARVAELRTLYFSELAKAAPPPAGALVVDKNPLSILRAPLINRLFPDARIILAMRHPADVVLSCWMQNFKPTEAMAGFLDIENAARTYDRVFDFWETARAVLPLTVHELRYEAMVADTEGALRPLVAFLGLEWEDGLLDHQRTARARGHIRTPSYAQVTEPVYARATGRWQRYRDVLAPALPILAPWCARYGYMLD